MTPLLSVIIPVYNGKKKLNHCIDSILSQSFKNYEILFIDDGSSDNSFDYLSEVIGQRSTEDHFRLFRQENRGVADTRNHGILLAEGRYIMFADQDDFFNQDYFRHLVEAIEETGNDMVISGYEHVKHAGTLPIKNKRIQKEYHVIDSVIPRNESFDRYRIITPWAHIYRRTFLLENNIRFLKTLLGEDIYFNLMICSKTDKISSISVADYKWLYNRESVSNTIHTMISDASNPLYLLNTLVENIDNSTFMQNEETEYYFTRLICWYLLYSFRGSKKGLIQKVYHELFQFLEDHYPDYLQNRYLKGALPQGESLKIHIIVQFFYILHRLNFLLPGMLLFGT